jgi:hypothetical protein
MQPHLELIDCEALNKLSPKSDHIPRANVGKPWDPQDLVLLESALARGMSCAEIAGFLDRREEEVRAKAEMLNRQKCGPTTRT